jgi:hypothetical protein
LKAFFPSTYQPNECTEEEVTMAVTQYIGRANLFDTIGRDRRVINCDKDPLMKAITGGHTMVVQTAHLRNYLLRHMSRCDPIEFDLILSTANTSDYVQSSVK